MAASPLGRLSAAAQPRTQAPLDTGKPTAYRFQGRRPHDLAKIARSVDRAVRANRASADNEKGRSVGPKGRIARPASTRPARKLALRPSSPVWERQ